MAKIKALKNFAGTLSMTAGQVIEYDDQVVINDLLKAGYIEVEGDDGNVGKRTIRRKTAKVSQN